MQTTRAESALDVFAVLGERVLQAWQRKHFSTDAFPDVAHGICAGFDFSGAALIEEVIVAAASQHNVVSRQGFSDLSIRVFDCQHFHIELLVWLEASTSIHEHGFSGAFRVLKGGSVHSRYRFDSEETISRQMSIGRPVLIGAEMLGEGDVRPIVSGAGTLHSLYHVARPSITVVVRTHSEPWAAPQHKVYRPHFSVDTLLRQDPRVGFCSAAVKSVRKLDESRARRLVQELLRGLDLPRAFSVCSLLIDWSFLIEEEFTSFLAETFGGYAHKVRDALVAERQLARLLRMRHVFHDEPSRLLLAIALNVPSRAAASELIRLHVSGASDFAETMTDLLYRVMKNDGFDFKLNDDTGRDIIALLLRNPSKDDFLAASKTAFGSSAEENEALLGEIFGDFASHSVVGHLLRDAPMAGSR